MIVKTYCPRMDHGGCRLLVHVENGEIIKVEGDPAIGSTNLRAVPCRVFKD